MAGRRPWMETSAPWMQLNIPRPGQCLQPGPMSPRRRLWTDGDPVWIQVGRGAGKSRSTSIESGVFSLPLSGKSADAGTSGPPVTPLNDRLKEFDKIPPEPEKETMEAERTSASHDSQIGDTFREDCDQERPVFDSSPPPCDVTNGGDISVTSPKCQGQIGRQTIDSGVEGIN